MAKKKATNSQGSRRTPSKPAKTKKRGVKRRAASPTTSACTPRTSKTSSSPSPTVASTKDQLLATIEIPAWLLDKPIAANKWHELLRELQSRSLLATVDLGLFALFCEAWQCFSDASEEVAREGLYFTTEKGYVGIHPAELVKDKAVKRIISLGDRLGIGVHARKGLSKATGASGENDQPDLDPLVAYAKLKSKR